MAILTETDLQVVQVWIQRDVNGVVTVTAQAKSTDATGEIIRTVSKDITDQLTAAQITSATTFMTNLAARLKTLWGIS